MSKRFVDTDKYKKPFFRSLSGAYKLLWDYVCLNCDHAGIWIKDFEIAQIYIGSDMQINETDALKYFNADEERIIIVNGGSRWFVKDFIAFQYKELHDTNKIHCSVINILKQFGIDYTTLKLFANPVQRVKDKKKDKVKDIDKVKERFNIFWEAYPRKASKILAEERWKKIKPSQELLDTILAKIVILKKCEDWMKDDGQFIPYPASWLRAGGWDDEVKPETDRDLSRY